MAEVRDLKGFLMAPIGETLGAIQGVIWKKIAFSSRSVLSDDYHFL